MTSWQAEKGRALPRNWESEIVPAIKARDKNRCRWVLPSGAQCPRRGTEVDHVGSPNDHRLIKLRLLCRKHHGDKTALQGVFARRQKKKPSRPPEQHPNR